MTLTVLQKKDGGVRGITRHHVSQVGCQDQFSKQVEAACAPFQFALSLGPESLAWGTQYES